MSHSHRPGPHSHPGVITGTEGPDEVPVLLDLLRAELYRILDELARSSREVRPELVSEFEQFWERFREVLNQAAPRSDQ